MPVLSILSYIIYYYILHACTAPVLRAYVQKKWAKLLLFIHIHNFFVKIPLFFCFFTQKIDFLQKKCAKICTCQKKAVPLHPFLEKGCQLLENCMQLSESMFGGHSSVGRASDCGSECRGFEPHSPPENKSAVFRLLIFIFAECVWRGTQS